VNNPQEYPYSTSLFLSADQEAAAFARYILAPGLRARLRCSTRTTITEKTT